MKRILTLVVFLFLMVISLSGLLNPGRIDAFLFQILLDVMLVSSLIGGMFAIWLFDVPGSQVILLFIVVGMILGVLAGFQLGPDAQRYQWLGDLFLQALQMIVIPLIVASLIVGVTQLGDVRQLSRVGAATVVYYVLTTGVSVSIGIILVNVMKPGIGVELSSQVPDIVRESKQFTVIDVIRGMVPSNLIQAAANDKILPLIVFSLLFGVVLTTLGEQGETVIQFFQGINDAIMKLVRLIMWFAPVGVFGLVAGILGEVGGGWTFLGEATRIARFCLTVILGLVIHGVFLLPLVLLLFGGRNPIPYTRNMLEAFFTAASTDSSSATLPVTMECVKDKNGVAEESADMVLPLGATINMDGTALYEAVAAIFIAQSYGVALTMGEQAVVFLTATFAAVGAAGIPHAGLVTMVLVLKSVGLPLEGIGLLLTVDWFLDRCRTTVNVFGDSVGAAVVERFLSIIPLPTGMTEP